jgi:LL-diaminopimelate aminotransferase
MFDISSRLKSLSEYPFAELDRKKKEIMQKGIEIIDLGIGDPDLLPFPSVIDTLKKSTQENSVHKYPSYKGSRELRNAVSKWYQTRFNIKLDPENEVLILIGAKEGIGHIPLAFVNPQDCVLVPNPGYHVYRAGTILADGIPIDMPLRKENGFLPDLDTLEKNSSALKKCKMMFINYPNNPTSAVADEDFFKKVIKFAKRHNIIVCHDATYSEITFDGFKTDSFLNYEGAKDIGIEFHSLSKSCNMTGWRIGFAVGNKDIIAGLGKVKTNLDSGVFNAVQFAAIEAINKIPENLKKTLPIYEQRRNLLTQALKEKGFDIKAPQATFYLWIPVPNGMKSAAFCEMLLEKCALLVTPGTGFGAEGEGYFRISLTSPTEQIEEAGKRIKNLKL